LLDNAGAASKETLSPGVSRELPLGSGIVMRLGPES